VTAATLDGRGFEPQPLRPRWLRPLVVLIVIALHAAALFFVSVTPKTPEQSGEVIVDIQPEAPPENPAPAAEEPKPPEQPAPAPAQDVAPAPTPVVPLVVEQPPPPVEAQPPLPPPDQPPPPVAEQPPPPPEEQPALPTPGPPLPPAPVELEPPPPPPPPPKTVEAAPPKPPPPLRVEAPKPQARPAPKPAPAPKAAETQSRPAPAQPSRGGPPTSAPSSAAASAASLSGYIGEVSAAIRSRLFYPPAARARGARGVVGVTFAIGPSGAVTSFAISRSSGDEDLDGAARALVQSAHFPPPPGGSARVSTSFNYVPP
jgi:periplasmic protein TonB